LSRPFRTPQEPIGNPAHPVGMLDATTILAAVLALSAAAVFAAMIWAGNHTH